MDVKTNLQVIILAITFFECNAAALLRTPKVYNALITTDQNLIPSRAYPAIQPALQDPFFYGPYGYTPYSGYYDPFGFNPFDSAAYVPKYNLDGTVNVNAATDESAQRSSSAEKDETAVIQSVNTEKAPIPLNEFGFPPSLIQLSQGKNPVNLAPFAYNSYPLIYDQYTGYPQSAYLPHFGVLPQTEYGFAGVTPAKIDSRIGGSEKAPIGSNSAGTEPAVTSAPGAGPDSRLVPVATPIAPGEAGLNGLAPPQSEAFGTAVDALNPIYFDRGNGVSPGGLSPAGIHGDKRGINNGLNSGTGIGKANDVNGGYNGSGIDDLNNHGFRTAASNNAAYGGVNSNRSTNRGVVNDARLRGSATSASGYAQNSGAGIRSSSSLSTTSNAASGLGSNSAAFGSGTSNNNATTSNASNGGVGARSSSSSRPGGQSTFSSSNGSQGSFVKSSQNIAKN